MKAVKAVQQNYHPTAEILHLLDEFRLMVNDSIRIGFKENFTSLKALSSRAYGQLNGYDAMSYYKLCAISAASGILRNYRKAVRKGERPNLPYARKPRLTTCYGFRIKNGKLFLPMKPGWSVAVPLATHTLETISGHDARSVTLTPSKLCISFVKDVEKVTPLGFIGIDRNLNNVTIAGTDSEVQQIDLTEATKVKSLYRSVKSKLNRNDARIRRIISQRYGLKESAKVQQILHHASKLIVQEAKRKQHGIVMEHLTGIRRIYRRGNGQSPSYRFRLNSWSYGELQRQIEYKARWEGLPVIYVKPQGTSARCSKCGLRMKPEEGRTLRCTGCGLAIDRDVNAARNILARGVRFAPVGLPREAMVQEPPQEVILKVDGSQLACPMTS